MVFRDRIEAGILLAEKLEQYRNSDSIVLAIPRGGVPVAFQVAHSLNLPFDLILIKKIGHPNHKEFAIGAVSMTDYFVVPDAKVSDEYIRQELHRIRHRISIMEKKFRGDRPPLNIRGKKVIIVDDGIATGSTILGTIEMLKKDKPAKIIVASPVASRNAAEMLSQHVDEVVIVLIPEHFWGVGGFYNEFQQLTDDEVKVYLDQVPSTGTSY